MSTMIVVLAVVGAVVALAIAAIVLLPTGSTPRIAPDSLRQSGILQGLLSG